MQIYTLTTNFILSYLLIAFSGCNDSSNTKESVNNEEYKVNIVRGPLLNSIVTDMSGQIATSTNTSGIYSFENSIKYPIIATGGFIDLNNNNEIDINEPFLDIELSTEKGAIVSLVTTLDRLPEYKQLLRELLNEDDIYKKSPLNNNKIAALSNVVFSMLKSNDVNFSSIDQTDLINNYKNYLPEYDGIKTTQQRLIKEQELINQLSPYLYFATSEEVNSANNTGNLDNINFNKDIFNHINISEDKMLEDFKTLELTNDEIVILKDTSIQYLSTKSKEEIIVIRNFIDENDSISLNNFIKYSDIENSFLKIKNSNLDLKYSSFKESFIYFIMNSQYFKFQVSEENIYIPNDYNTTNLVELPKIPAS